MTKARFKKGDEVLIALKSTWPHWNGRMDAYIGKTATIHTYYGAASGQPYYGLLVDGQGIPYSWPDDALDHPTEEARAARAKQLELERLKELPFIIDDLVFTDVRGNVLPEDSIKSFTKEQLIGFFEKQRKNLVGPTTWGCAGYNTDFSYSQACHAEVWERSITGYMLNIFTLDYYGVNGRTVSEFQKACDKWYYEKYLFHPKYSPWKDTIKEFILIRNPKLDNMPIGFLVEGDALQRIDKKMFGNLCIATRHPYEYPMYTTSMFNINKHVNYKPISFALSRHISFTEEELTDLKINPMLMYTGHQHILGNCFARLLKKAPGIVGVKYPMDKRCSAFADKEIWQGTSKLDTTNGTALTVAFEKILSEAKTEIRGSRFSKNLVLPVTELSNIGKAIKALVDKYEPDDPKNNAEIPDPYGYDDDDDDYHDADAYHDDDDDNYDEEGNLR